MRSLAAIFGVIACGGGAVPPAVVGDQPTDTFVAKPPAQTPDRDRTEKKAAPDPLFPERKAGWDELSAAGKKAADSLAREYLPFATTAKTPRRAVSALIAMAEATAGAAELSGDRVDAKPGSIYFWSGPGGDAAAIVRVGSRPITDGVRLVVAAVDAPRIDLKQNPVYDEAGITMLDTYFYGAVEWQSWLVTAMALYVYAARPGSSSGNIDLVVGEAETDPVLSIPDLLPHLSGRVQRKQVVDSAERLDAVAASSRAALTEFLSGHGVDDRAFQDAEASLVPAGPAVFVGVDRALIAGYGHSHRALAFAATRALLDENAPTHAAMVVVISKLETESTGSSGPAFVKTALSRALGALSEHGRDIDILDTRRAYSRSSAVISARIEAAERNKGIAMNTRADDALPDATRRAIDRMAASGAQLQVTFDASWQGDTRRLAALDIDAVGVALPTTGYGTPMELLSVLDLYSGYLAMRGWMTAK